MKGYVKIALIVGAVVTTFVSLCSCQNHGANNINTTGTIIVPKQFICSGGQASTVANAKSQALNNSQFIYFTYEVILNRMPDKEGFEGSCAGLASGMSRTQYIWHIVNSPEFKQLLANSQKKP